MWQRFWQSFLSSKFFNAIKNKYVIATVAFLLLICFLDNNTLGDWAVALRTLSSHKAEQRYYKEQINQTEQQLRELQSNRDSLEKFAREHYYFHQDSEDVYIIAPAPEGRANHDPRT